MSSKSALEILSPKVQELKEKLEAFVLDKCQPAEIEYEKHLENLAGKERWTLDAVPPCVERLKTGVSELRITLLFICDNFNDGVNLFLD